MYALQLNAIPAWGLQMSLGLRDSMELVQVQKLSPKFPTPHGRGGLLIRLIFFFFLIRINKINANGKCILRNTVPNPHACPSMSPVEVHVHDRDRAGQHSVDGMAPTACPANSQRASSISASGGGHTIVLLYLEICRISLSSSALPTSLQEKH